MTSAFASSSSKSTSRMEGIIERAWEDYRLLSKSSTQLKPTCDQILSMIGSLHMINDHLQTSDLSSSNKKALRGVESWCHSSLSELEAALTTARSKTGPDRFRAIVNRALDPTNKLPSFVDILRSDQQKNILGVLSQLNVEELQESSITEWSVLEAELEKLGLPKDVIEEDFFFISDWLKENLLEQVEEDEELPDYTGKGPKPIPERLPSERAEEDGDLPDYTPGEGRKPIQEKVQDLDETTRDLTITDSTATSSTANPPPYTFEEGDGQPMMDNEFSQFIETAKSIDLNLRMLRKRQHPELVNHNPTAWLPKAVQAQYKNSKDVIPIMPADSFTVMAYETAPKCSDEIDRLRHLLRTTFEHKPSTLSEGIIHEAIQALGVMSSAMSKYALVQNQKSGVESFSDLDVLDFEFSTAVVLDKHMHFPEREFDLARKSYYLLLTYVMGFLEAMNTIFPGRTYISTSMNVLESAWKENKMNTRVAWVEKRLAGWDDVEQAANFCRDWHRMRPNLSHQVQTALQMWERSEMILSGSQHEKQTMEVTVVAASGLPKSNFKTWVKVIFYGPNKFGGALRLFELETDTVKGTQKPTWNKSFLFELPYQSKMIDFEIYDRVAGMAKQLGKLRLAFTYVPGVEANFANRSLIYGYDEEVDFPLTSVEGKGKEREQSLLRLGLKWQGRMAKVEELGLPTRPPGKMFRQGILGIPEPAEETVGNNNLTLAHLT